MKWLIVFLLAIVPLPFGSARAEWQWFWIIYISAAGLWLVLATRKIKNPLGIEAAGTYSGGLLCFVLFVIWCFFQATDVTGTGALSIEPLQSIKVAALFLAHGLFFVICYTYGRQQPGQLKTLLKIFSFIVVVYSLYGFFSFVLDGTHVLWYPKTAYKIALTSSFINPNNFAAYCGLGLITSTSLTLSWLGRNRSQPAWQVSDTTLLIKSFIREGWFYIASALFCMTALLMTGSRAGVLSVMAGLLVLFFLWIKSKKGFSSSAFAWVFGMIGILIILWWFSGTYFNERLEKEIFSDQRFDVYPAILHAIWERPITGYGIGSFETAFRMVRPSEVTLFFDRAHSDYLELAMTAGLPASAVFLFSLFLLVFNPLVRSHNARVTGFKYMAVGVLTQLSLHAVVDFPFQIPAISLSAVFLLALCLAAIAANEAKTRSDIQLDAPQAVR
ncbi:O-antigen ligase family protein [Kordiimonas aestuarii]|uniref:O-antigen ligase family protein n=1 Tax=Kordiimonas aestuarii TaxID=1005925 RepID=UPI0021D2D476|nr:O-antigen ligase family protein [Kordiimonas aestuarii]